MYASIPYLYIYYRYMRTRDALFSGPSGWVNTYADCGLNSQSPIDIVTTSVTTNNSLDSLAFANYDDTSVTMTLVNGGYGGEWRSISNRVFLLAKFILSACCFQFFFTSN